MALDRATQAAIRFHARRVIFAAPQFLTHSVIQHYRAESPAHLGEFHYSPWMVANLWLRDRPQERGFPLAWDNVIYDSPSLGYVTATHQRGLDHGPTVFTYYYPFCAPETRTARERLLSLDWQACADTVLSDLRRPHPDLHTLVQRIDIMKWGHAMIQPRPGFIWGRARQVAARPYRGIHFAHTDLSGMALFEEAFFHGLRAADEMLALREQGVFAEQPP